MKFSIVTGASLILAIAINNVTADQIYFNCKRNDAPMCPLKGIEEVCPATNGEFGPQDCFSDDQKSLCGTCSIDDQSAEIGQLFDWCLKKNGLPTMSQEKPQFPPFCGGINF
jgi:hypothetical protein